MSFLVSDIFARSRDLLQDTDAGAYRWADAELLRWASDCMDSAVDARPDLFIETAQHTCANGAIQTLALDRLRAIAAVPRIQNGSAITLTDRAMLDLFTPGWYGETPSAVPVHWMPHSERNKFYLYPPVSGAPTVEVEVTRSPAQFTATTDVVPLPDNYLPACASYVASRALMKEDEAAAVAKGQAFLAEFVAGMKGG